MCTRHFTTLLIAAGAGLSIVSAAAQSQDPHDAPGTARWSMGSLSIQFGVDRLGLSELNKTMVANGRPAFADDAGTIGLSGYARFGRVLIGGTGETALPRRELAGGFTNRIWYGRAAFDAGYAVIDRPRVMIYPQVSFGLKHSVLQMQESGDFTFANGVNDPARGLAMSSWRAMAGYGLVGELRLSTRSLGAFSIGVRGGYATPVGGARTSAGESSVSGTPSEEAGTYLRLSIGKPIGRRRNALSVLSTVLIPMMR